MNLVPIEGNGDIVLGFEDGSGKIGISRIDTPIGQQVWIHDVEHTGEPDGLVRLMLAARKQARDWGFDEFRTNVTLDSPLANVWLDHGFELDQLILKRRI